jgi:hypothetical protein
MDNYRSNVRRTIAKIILMGGIVFVLYIFLTRLDTPGITPFEIIKGISKLFLFFIPGTLASIPGEVWLVFFDLLLFLFVLILGISFFAQYTLPVRHILQRVQAALYLNLYMVGLHGPAIKVDNGEVPAHYTKGKARGRGAILLDTASGALLRTKTGLTRSVGPGLVFTRRGEYLADATDLHVRVWPVPPLGPRGDGEDPFADWDERREPLEAYEQRELRRSETLAMTRDGIEIVANISAASRLDPDLQSRWGEVSPLYRESRWDKFYQTETKSKFGYNAESVRLAIIGEAIDPNISEIDPGRRYTPWFQIPAYITVDLWREYLRKFTFEDLFTRLDNFNGKTALQVIQEKVLERQTKYWVDELNPVGEQTDDKLESHEYVVLQGRGIRVISSSIRNLHFARKVDQHLEDKWFSNWLWRARDERDYVNRLRSIRTQLGVRDGLRDFAYNASRRFGPRFLLSSWPQNPQAEQKQMEDALKLMLIGTWAQCHRDTYLHQRLAGEERQLAEIINWI